MLFWSHRNRSRRLEIRKNRLEGSRSWWDELRASGALPTVGVAAAFFLVTAVILMFREDVVPYRPGQYVPHDITARVDFVYPDKDKLASDQTTARENEPRVYVQSVPDVWTTVEQKLLALPSQVRGLRPDQLLPPARELLDSGTITTLEQTERKNYDAAVRQYVRYAREHVRLGDGPLVVLNDVDRQKDHDRKIVLKSAPDAPPAKDREVDVDAETVSAKHMEPVQAILASDAFPDPFPFGLRPKINSLILAYLGEKPTYELSGVLTAEAQNRAAGAVPTSYADLPFMRDMVIVPRGVIGDRDWQILRAENEAFHQKLTEASDSDPFWQRFDKSVWKERAGIAVLALIITFVLSAYVARYQPRVIRNPARAIAIAALLVSMLLLSILAGVGSSSLYIFGIAPTITAAIILTIAYDQRLAIGIGSVHAMLVTFALNQGLSFFLILWIGVVVACYLLDDIRTRSKLIEVGGASALAMMLVTAAAGALALDPISYLWHNCLYAGAAGLAAGFVVLGILPFIEKAFRITTSMTLLELADASQPLLRRLALEAPGTYNHSLQVATLAEAAAEAIGANSLSCRVGAYYHDIGKVNKADYFVENQLGGPSRHLNLSPSVSLLIIIGHVKDGVEMAKEYNLPTSLLPFIQQHHGTTLVEYFYHQACTQQESKEPDGPAISDTQYRYPGPKPRSKETAIVMICDAVESACRAMREPSAGSIEDLVHKLILKRLHDGQFDECDLTMRDLERIEQSVIKSLLGIYHGRIAYPSTSDLQAPVTPPAARTA